MDKVNLLDLFTRRALRTSPASSDECDTSKSGELMVPCDVKDEGPLCGAVAVRSDPSSRILIVMSFSVCGVP